MKHGVAFSLLLFCLCSVLQAYRWSTGLKDKAHISACVNGNVSFPWSIVIDGEGEKILDIDWLFQAPGEGNVSLASRVDGEFFTKPHRERFTFLPNAGLFLQGAQAQDAGRYYVRVNLHDPKCRLTSAERVVTLTLADRPPITQDGSLHVTLRDAIQDDVTEDWTLQFYCGVFVDLGHPPVDVIWTTPLGEARNSSQQDGGTFVLSVSSPVQGGNYSCHLPPSTPAARCLPATSPLRTAAQLSLDDRDVRLSLLEARQGELLQENKDQASLIQQQGVQISQLQEQSQSHNQTVSQLEQDNKDQASLIQQQANLLQQQGVQITQLQEQNLHQKESIAQLTSQFASLSQALDNLQERLRECHVTALNASSCVDWLKFNASSGIRTVRVTGEPITVYCDQTTDHGGWIVFQRRVDASVDFYRGWEDYRRGFGDLEGNFWLGLDKLHSLTTSQSYELRVDLEMWNGTKGHATYSGFYVDGASNNFALHFDNFTGGNAGDSLSYQRGMAFTTKDRDHDHDIYNRNCAQRFHGAWWYRSCFYSNLNGVYKPNSSAPDSDGINWISFGGSDTYSMKFSEMKIRPM